MICFLSTNIDFKYYSNSVSRSISSRWSWSRYWYMAVASSWCQDGSLEGYKYNSISWARSGDREFSRSGSWHRSK